MLRKQKCSKEYKLKIVKEHLNNHKSSSHIEREAEIIYSLIKNGLNNMKLTEILKILISHILKEYIPEDKEIYMTKSRKVNKQERIGIVKYCMDNDLNYTKAAEAYETTYTNIFSWLRSIVKKV